ncbi:TolC family protein [Salegentibacter sp. HM20]
MLASKNIYVLLGFFLLAGGLMAQEDSLSYREFLVKVLEDHPVVRQAGLVRQLGDAEVQAARGAFDPRFEVDYKAKEYKGTEYYDLLDAQLKIPTWYGLQLKGGFQQNQGVYVNPQNTVPEAGLFQAGVVLSLGEGLWINSRMAGLRQAQAYQMQSRAEQQLIVNDILMQASFVYFDWMQAYEKVEIYTDFLENANERYQGIRRRVQTGDLAGIDSVEARILLQNRKIQLARSQIELTRKRLELSTYIWDNDQALILRPEVEPGDASDAFSFLMQVLPNAEANLATHPQLEFFRRRVEALEIERRYRINRLLPQIDLEYNLLSEQPDNFETFNPGAYKAGLRFSMPLFLRQERGELKIAEYELEDARWELNLQDQQLQARLQALELQLENYREQQVALAQLLADSQALLNAELRKFSFGESSIFLINTRESALLDAQLDRLELEIQILKTQAEFLQTLGTNPLD